MGYYNHCGKYIEKSTTNNKKTDYKNNIKKQETSEIIKTDTKKTQETKSSTYFSNVKEQKVIDFQYNFQNTSYIQNNCQNQSSDDNEDYYSYEEQETYYSEEEEEEPLSDNDNHESTYAYM